MSASNKILLPVALLALLMAALVGCTEPTTTTTTAATPEPDYARAITETVMQGLDESDLAKYTQYGNSEFKAAVTQEVLDAAAGPLKTQYGDYGSIEYLSTETQDEYTIVHYRAKFTRGELGIRMVFDEDHLVAGQWFE